MDELGKYITKQTGWSFTEPELIRIYSRYSQLIKKLSAKNKSSDGNGNDNGNSNKNDFHTTTLTKEDHKRVIHQLIEDLRDGMRLRDQDMIATRANVFNTTISNGGNNDNSNNRPGTSSTNSSRPSTATVMNSLRNKNNSKQLKFQEIVEIIRNQLLLKLENLKGENQLKKAYLLLGESRSTIITRAQLKSACQHRLNIYFNDQEVDEIFNHLDANRQGTIHTRKLINFVLKNTNEYSDNTNYMSLPIGDNAPNSTQTSASNTPLGSARRTINNIADDVQNARMTYDNRIEGLIDPTLVKANHGIFSKTRKKQAASSAAKAATLGDFINSNTTSNIFVKPASNNNSEDINVNSLYSVEDIEDIIWQKVFEKSSFDCNMLQSLLKLFTGGAHNQKFITQDQLKYTLWKKMRLSVSEEALTRFYQHHARHSVFNYAGSDNFAAVTASSAPGNKVIDVFYFIDQIVKKRGSQEPLINDRNQNDRQNTKVLLTNNLLENAALQTLLILVRRAMNALTNRESRAPHYLLHQSARMTFDQARAFLSSKLQLDFSGTEQLRRLFSEVLCREYLVDGQFVDMKRVILEAMALPDHLLINTSSNSNNNNDADNRSNSTAIGILPHQTLLNGALVTVNQLPASLQYHSTSPDQIEAAIRVKCEERLKNEHPHATLRRLFMHENKVADNNAINLSSSASNRQITREALKKVLHKFDIILSEDDFTRFFQRHVTHAASNTIDISVFLQRILPKEDPDSNPFLPKDDETVKQQLKLATALKDITGKRKEVGRLTGTNQIRMNDSFMRDVANHESQPPTDLDHNEPPAVQQRTNNNNNNSNNSNGSEEEIRWRLAESLAAAMKDLPVLQSLTAANQPTNANEARGKSHHRSSPALLKSTNTNGDAASAAAVGHAVHFNFNTDHNTQTQRPKSASSTVKRPSSASALQTVKGAAADAGMAIGGTAMTLNSKNSNANEANNNNAEEDKYRLQQSGHFLALAQAYMNYQQGASNNASTSNKADLRLNLDKINSNTDNNDNAPSTYSSSNKHVTKVTLTPNRPSSAPPSMSRTRKTACYSPSTNDYIDRHQFTVKHSGNTTEQGESQSPMHSARTVNSHTTTNSNSTVKVLATTGPFTPRDEFNGKFTYSGQSYNHLSDPVNPNLRQLIKFANQHITTTQHQYGLFHKPVHKVDQQRRELFNKQRTLKEEVYGRK